MYLALCQAILTLFFLYDNIKKSKEIGVVSIMDEDKKEVNEPKKIEVVTGNGDLNISPVYEHLEIENPKPKENRTILVPEVKKVKNNDDSNKSTSESNTTEENDDSNKEQ